MATFPEPTGITAQTVYNSPLKGLYQFADSTTDIIAFMIEMLRCYFSAEYDARSPLIKNLPIKTTSEDGPGLRISAGVADKPSFARPHIFVYSAGNTPSEAVKGLAITGPGINIQAGTVQNISNFIVQCYGNNSLETMVLDEECYRALYIFSEILRDVFPGFINMIPNKSQGLEKVEGSPDKTFTRIPFTWAAHWRVEQLPIDGF